MSALPLLAGALAGSGTALGARAVVLLAARGAPARDRLAPGRPRTLRAPAGAVAGVALLAVVAAVAAAGLLPVSLAVGAVVGGRWVVRRRRGAAVRRTRDRAVPDLVDQFVLAASSGCPVAQAVAVVAPRAPPPLRPDVSDALARFRRGLPLAEALAGLGRALGPEGEPLTDVLARAAAGGTPLGPALADVAATARDRRRRRAQEAAHRLPVTLLFPLTLCVLPAALVLAVVPILAAAVASLAP